MTNAATIKAAREAAGLSAREAAALVGVTTVTWQRWEGQTSRATEIPYAHWTLFLLLTEGQKMVAYNVYNPDAEYLSDAYEGYPLRAKTARGARIEAKKLASEKGWKKLRIEFFRDTDGCHGEIDA